MSSRQPKGGDWRERVEKTLGINETNTAALLPGHVKRYTADGLSFGSQEEVTVWEALKAK